MVEGTFGTEHCGLGIFVVGLGHFEGSPRAEDIRIRDEFLAIKILGTLEVVFGLEELRFAEDDTGAGGDEAGLLLFHLGLIDVRFDTQQQVTLFDDCTLAEG